VTERSIEKPRWLRDLLRFLPLRSQFVVSGNVRDLQVHEPFPGTVTAAGLSAVLVDQLKNAGYQRVATFDPLSGFRDIHGGSNPSEADGILRAVGLMPTNGAAAGGIDLLAQTLERFVSLDGTPAVLVIDFASRLVIRHEALSAAEHQLFSRALILSHSARANSDRAGCACVWLRHEQQRRHRREPKGKQRSQAPGLFVATFVAASQNVLLSALELLSIRTRNSQRGGIRSSACRPRRTHPRSASLTFGGDPCAVQGSLPSRCSLLRPRLRIQLRARPLARPPILRSNGRRAAMCRIPSVSDSRCRSTMPSPTAPSSRSGSVVRPRSIPSSARASCCCYRAALVRALPR
jgi:hypothetical protein